MPADQHLVYTIPSSSFKTAIFDKNSTLSFKDKQAERRQMNFYVNYDRTFGQHSISAMASIERYESFYDSRDIEYADLAHDISDTYLGVGGPSIVGPDGKSALASDNTVTLKGESGSLSYLGRVAYSYADRYMLHLFSVRTLRLSLLRRITGDSFPVSLQDGSCLKNHGSNARFLGLNF